MPCSRPFLVEMTARNAACKSERNEISLEVHIMNAKVVLWGGGKQQAWEREALMIAATAGIGTAVGALISGKKGATFGAVSAGVTRFLMRMLSW